MCLKETSWGVFGYQDYEYHDTETIVDFSGQRIDFCSKIQFGPQQEEH